MQLSSTTSTFATMVRAGYGASGHFEGRVIHAAAEATQNLTRPLGRHFITTGPKKARTLAVPGLGEFPSARGGWRRGVAARYAASPVPALARSWHHPWRAEAPQRQPG